MKGVHLARVTKAQGGVRVPLNGVQVQTLLLNEPRELHASHETLVLLLEGEAVFDIPGDFVHLRRGDSFTLPVETVTKMNPVQSAVLMLVHEICVTTHKI
jgi:hypothetical protein